MAAEPDYNSYNVTITLPSGEIELPISEINAFYDETISVTMNYGAQLGACIAMFLVCLALTPRSKITRLSSVLHLLGLLVCIVRTGLLFSYYVSPFSHFYEVWSGDLSGIPRLYFDESLAANTLALPLVVIIQAALVNQAWTMVAFWPKIPKYSACILSAIVALLTIGTRLAFTIVQNHAILTSIPPVYFLWGIHWMLIMSAISIFWFCAIFNLKLVMHLVTNRGILPSTSVITPMEVLIMTNGTLMIIPCKYICHPLEPILISAAVFAGLEWANFTNFEAASLTMTSVIIILPLGTLMAQRISSQGSQSYLAGSNFRRQNAQGTAQPLNSRNMKKPSDATMYSRATDTPQASVASRADVSLIGRTEPMDPIDLELSRIDAFRESSEYSHNNRLRRDDIV